MKIESIFVIFSCVLSAILLLRDRQWLEHNVFGKESPGYTARIIIMYLITAISCFCILHSIYLLIKQL